MQRYDVLFTPDAVQDLNAIYDYIADESGLPTVALSYMQKLRTRCNEVLSIAPIRGQARNDLRQGLRITPLDTKAVVAFEVNDTQVLVLSIVHSGEAYEALMWQRIIPQ